MKAVMTPVATPRAKDPLKTPRKMPKDFNMAMASKLWLLSPAGWYATMELKVRQTAADKRYETIYMKTGGEVVTENSGIQEVKVGQVTNAQVQTRRFRVRSF